jgi:Fe-S cluster assembly protein SufB
MARFAHKNTTDVDDSLKQDNYEHGYSFSTDQYSHISKPGLTEQTVREISHMKGEPAWMLQRRLEGYAAFLGKPMPPWGADLSDINFDAIRYYLRPTDSQATSWDKVPASVKETFERLGIPEAERSHLAGVKAQYDSEVVYGSLKNVWAKDGVQFLSMDEGLKLHEDLIKEYFGKVIPLGDNKFAALNTAVWSGGSFVYVPPGVEVKMPLQTYFRINAENAGQFERTLIIVDEGAKVHYIEGCTAPNFSSGSLHSAVVEIFVKKGARCQYTTVQNWYKNIYNLVTKRAYVEAEGEMVWTDFNMGSKVTMKYPGFVLAGPGAKGETLSMALAGSGQHQDTGSKAIHLAPHTSSTIISKSIAKDGGRTSYRGLVNIGPNAHHSKNTVICDALLLDPESRSDTYPTDKVFNSQVEVQHEATVSKIGDDQLFYLMSRGITEENSRKMVVNGFIEDLVRKLPLEYAVEMNRLIDHEMEGSIG